jgi:SAM-dependent methyltransferase
MSADMKRRSEPMTASPQQMERHTEVALKLYEWPPSYAFLRACMLDAYAAAIHNPPTPIIDIGCGDGRFATALIECGLISGIAVALDRSENDLRHAPAAIRARAVAGDLLALPFDRGSACTVVCNAALNCLLSGRLADLDVALAELNRILRPDGRLVCCVHTTEIDKLYLGYQILSSLRLRGLALRYLNAMHRSNGRTIHLSAQQWGERIADAGFTVDLTIQFYTHQQSRLRRLLRLLGHLPSRRLALAIRGRLVRSYRKPICGDHKQGSGHLLLLARKTERPASQSQRTYGLSS